MSIAHPAIDPLAGKSADVPQPSAASPAVSNGTARPPRIRFDLTEKKTIRIALLNVLYVLEQHPAWKDSLGFDELLADVVLLKRPPYLTGSTPWQTRPITEQDERETANWLQRTYQFYANSTLAGDGLTTYAYRHPFHAIRAYLAGLVWDGEARLDTWLGTYCHVATTDFTRAVASKTLIAAVARVYEPGCKVDTMTILEGKQGLIKSTVWNTLASDAWFSDTLPDLHDKDAMQALRGKWFVEFAELTHFQRSEVETVKRFVSAKQDHYRPSFGKKAQTFPRQNVFVACTNEANYFKDRSGNRRFWPVKMEGEADIAGLVRDRDQLWAEAVVRYRQHERWYLTPAQELLARQEQSQRMELDDWERRILKYAEDHAEKSSDGAYRCVTTEDVLVHGLHIENMLYVTQANTKRVASILREHNWEHRQVRATPQGKQFWAYTRSTAPEVAPDVPCHSAALCHTCHGNSPSNGAPQEACDRCDTCWRLGVCEGVHVPRDSMETPVTHVTGVTAPDSERPAGVSPATNWSGPREVGPGAEVVLSVTEETETALAGFPLGDHMSFSTLDHQHPPVHSRIGSLGATGQPCPESETGQHTMRAGRCIWCTPKEGVS